VIEPEGWGCLPLGAKPQVNGLQEGNHTVPLQYQDRQRDDAPGPAGPAACPGGDRGGCRAGTPPPWAATRRYRSGYAAWGISHRGPAGRRTG